MKICPICSQTYGDETLKFCLNDGAVLERMSGTAKTAVMTEPGVTSPNRSARSPQNGYPTEAFSTTLPSGKSRIWLWVLLAFGGVILIGGSAFLVLRMFSPTQENRNANVVANASSASEGTRSVLTPEKYDKLKNGMTYKEVVEIMGSEGSEFSRSEIGRFTTLLYKWEDGPANIIVTFSNDRLVVKSQSGVK